jgi:RNA polymerase sigma factor (sigma-70 family)
MSHAQARPRLLPGHPAAAHSPRTDGALTQLVCAARAGDSAAWSSLVTRFDGLLRSIAGGYRLSSADVDDVIQATWLTAFESIDELGEPEAIGGWLATMMRRKALRLLQKGTREILTDDVSVGDGPDLDGPEERLLAAELRGAFAAALATLPGRQRRLMTILAGTATPDYDRISQVLSMPRGSIGPIRGRSLDRLSRHPQLRALR